MARVIRCCVQFGAPQGYCDFGGKTPNHPYFGATIGRVANRIAKGSFELGELGPCRGDAAMSLTAPL